METPEITENAQNIRLVRTLGLTLPRRREDMGYGRTSNIGKRRQRAQTSREMRKGRPAELQSERDTQTLEWSGTREAKEPPLV